MSSPNTMKQPVTIEYDFRGGRRRVTFSDAYKAKSAWIRKDQAGKNPKVIKPT